MNRCPRKVEALDGADYILTLDPDLHDEAACPAGCKGPVEILAPFVEERKGILGYAKDIVSFAKTEVCYGETLG